MSDKSYSPREPAVRLFSTEFNRVKEEFRESDEERAPRYALLPSGVKANRVHVSGVLTTKEEIGSGNSEFWKGFVADGSGEEFSFVVGERNEQILSALRDISPPEYVTIIGKFDLYTPEDEDEVADVSIGNDVEVLTVVDEETTNYWKETTAEQSLDRLNSETEYDGRASEVYGDERNATVLNGVTDVLSGLK